MRSPCPFLSCSAMIIAASLLVLPATGRAQTPGVEPASLVVTNARIVTMDSRMPRAEALAARGEWIVAVGTVEEIQSFIGPDTKVLDAGGRLVIPGFHDAHAHFGSGASGLRTLNLYGVDSKEEVLRLVAERVAQAAPGEWITGSRYDHTLWTSSDDWPTRYDLDRVAPDNPVRLTRASGHSSWVNSMALRLSGITRETADPPAGEVQRDPATGEPTGILIESAQGLVRGGGGDRGMSAEERHQRQKDDLLAGFRHAARLGVTSVTTSSSLAEMDLLRELKADGQLTLRWTGWLSIGGIKRYVEQGLRTGDGDDWIRIGMAKIFIDGTLGDGSAAMFEPFTDRPDFLGLPTMTQEELTRLIVYADRHGWQTGTHAIGDKGSHLVLNAVEQALLENGTRDMRHRIEHAQLLKPDDIRRFGQLGVIASMQPTHCTTDMRFAEERVGYDRCKTAYAWRSLLDAGAVLAFGTDWSVEPLDPMRGVFSSVTRTNIQRMEPVTGWFPEQKLTVWETIYYYTWGAAYADHQENVKGTLAPGRLADMVVMDRDLFTIPPAEILSARVDLTVVGGRVVWDRVRDLWNGGRD
jgi:predicted amidohydrolase YtcJ